MNFLYWIGLLLTLIAGVLIGLVLYYFVGQEGVFKFISVAIAGGFGGMIHGLIEDGGSGKLRMPRSEITTDNDTVADLGIIGEWLVGMMGAIVSILVIAVFLGSDPFTDPNSPVSVFRLIAFGALAGFAARQFLPNLAKKFSDQLNEEFKTHTNAAEKKIKDTAATSTARQEALVEQTRIATRSQENVAAFLAQGEFNLETLEPLVQQFTAITHQSHPEYRERVRAMMNVADQMAELTPPTPAVKQVIAQHITSAQQKAWLLPLSTIIASKPEEGDAICLLDAYDRALSDAAVRDVSKFILYRILLAIMALSDAFLLSDEQKPRAQQIAQACQLIDDKSLAKRAEVVLEMLK
ncbi:hypothetical protein C5Y96_11180 [Blastopirellula marina]|uniref:Uncharacterized protein n=1 Tax=Blastopirellula marina TaxID=124 RepID=A0A2S8FML4_9BACT|nr:MULTISPECIES: hypothetical protein [Pirellulaceae]PQO33401.1 hypothetical protein C5Y96_11180 [Blastopirellula marina]RCS52491.1 hypothetical protein DTL36_11190 [Bremerella cremea]